jgi:hypothetical protein
LRDTLRERIAIFFLINALLLPIIVFSDNLMVSGAFMLLLIVSQGMIIGLFLKSDEPDAYEWYSLASVVVCSLFILSMLIAGRNSEDQIFAIILSVAYLISAGVFFASRKVAPLREEVLNDEIESGLAPDEIKTFREKDELAYLVETFDMADPKDQKHLNDFPEVKNQPYVIADNEDFMIDAPKPEPEAAKVVYKVQEKKDKTYLEENKGYIEFFPEENQEEKKQPTFVNNVQIVNLKPTQVLDTEAIKKARDTIETGATNISDKIRLIAEKAILEGAEKKLRKMVTESKIKKLEDTDFVYASITGDRYHTIRTCMSLKRVRRKDIVLFENAKDAKKKGLKPCGLCNR